MACERLWSDVQFFKDGDDDMACEQLWSDVQAAQNAVVQDGQTLDSAKADNEAARQAALDAEQAERTAEESYQGSLDALDTAYAAYRGCLSGEETQARTRRRIK